MSTTLSELTEVIQEFINARDWNQFHDPKDLAISLSLEASEVLEHYQWKNNEEVDKGELSKELVDVLYWVLLMAANLDIDLGEAFKKKMEENEKKYPVEKAKGNKAKYTKL